MTGYGPVTHVNRLVRTRMLGRVGAVGEKPPTTRLDFHLYSVEMLPLCPSPRKGNYASLTPCCPSPAGFGRVLPFVGHSHLKLKIACNSLCY